MRPYQYRCHDYSLLTPPFKRWVITPLIKFVPWVIPANIITFISNGIVYVGLYLALHPQILGTATSIIVALCLILYLIGDHLDGMQAKRTGTGSALGEFCDHYLDAFNNGVVMFTMALVFGITHKPVIAGVMVVSYWAHMAVFYEQLKTGWLTFERVGSLEGVLLSAILIGLSAIPPIADIFYYRIYQDYTLIEGLLILSSLGAILTFAKTAKRIPNVKSGFWIFTFFLALVSALAVPFFSSIQLFVIVTLYGSLYIGRLMHGHLIDGEERQTDFITPILLILLYIPSFAFSFSYFTVITIYLSLHIAILIFKTFSALRMYWVWINARA